MTQQQETMFKIIRQSREEIGAPAKTDFVKIYIDEGVSGKEFLVLLKHEKSHIWLEHNKRYVKGMEHSVWTMATEMEIARNIYSPEDIAVISSPMSMIKGGILPDTIPDLPQELTLAEEIYDWLIKNKDAQESCKDKHTCDCSDHKDKQQEGSSQRAEAQQVRQKIQDVKEAIEQAVKSAEAEKSVLENLKEIRNRRPTLVSIMDSLLRKRHEREQTFRRPSRREYGNDVIVRGRMTFQRPPLVEIFVDRSGSFTPEKTRKAQDALKDILKRYNSSVKNDVWFFGSGKISAKDFEGGDTPYHLIIEHINRTTPKIAVIVTDDDSCCDFKELPKGTQIITVPIGCSQTDFARKTKAIEVLPV